jgi:hypothetical protein
MMVTMLQEEPKLGCLRNKTSASASASASAKNSIFWSHVKKRPLALALALGKASEKGPLALALPSLALTQNKRRKNQKNFKKNKKIDPTPRRPDRCGAVLPPPCWLAVLPPRWRGHAESVG